MQNCIRRIGRKTSEGYQVVKRNSEQCSRQTRLLRFSAKTDRVTSPMKVQRLPSRTSVSRLTFIQRISTACSLLAVAVLVPKINWWSQRRTQSCHPSRSLQVWTHQLVVRCRGQPLSRNISQPQNWNVRIEPPWSRIAPTYRASDLVHPTWLYSGLTASRSPLDFSRLP